MTVEVRQSKRKDTLRCVNLLRKRLRSHATSEEMMKAATNKASTMSTTMKPALHSQMMICVYEADQGRHTVWQAELMGKTYAC